MPSTDTASLSEIFGSRADTKSALASREDLFQGPALASERRHKVFRSDFTDGIAVPNVIIPFNTDTEDFFATVATYYQDLSPVSAVAHILDRTTADLFMPSMKKAGSVPPAIGDLARRTCVGSAIGEAVLAGIGSYESTLSISYAACRRTLAYCLARTRQIHGLKISPNAVAERWTHLRRLTGLSPLPSASEAILLTHQLAFSDKPLMHSLRLDVRLQEALRPEALGSHEGRELLLSALVDLYPQTESYLNDLNGAFDGRLTAFRHLVNAVQSNSKGRDVDEIAVAVFCDAIQPGSFAHAGILITLADFYPSALIWYGYLCGGSRQLSPGLITKLERDIVSRFSFVDRPQCDISLEELEVLSRAKLRTDSIKPSQQRALLVGILPGVDVYTRFGAEADPAADRARSSELEHMHSRVSRILEEALATLRKASPISVSQYPPYRPKNKNPSGRRKDLEK